MRIKQPQYKAWFFMVSWNVRLRSSTVIRTKLLKNEQTCFPMCKLTKKKIIFFSNNNMKKNKNWPIRLPFPLNKDDPFGHDMVGRPSERLSHSENRFWSDKRRQLIDFLRRRRDAWGGLTVVETKKGWTEGRRNILLSQIRWTACCGGTQMCVTLFL